MNNIPAVAHAMQHVLTDVAEQAATESRLVRRRSKLTGPRFVQTLVFGWLADPDASLSALTRMAATLGVFVSPQALFQRFTPQAAECLRQVLHAAASRMIAANPVAIPVLRRFSAVLIQDSTVITLPPELQEQWPGCGGSHGSGKSALKLQVQLDQLTGRLLGPFLTAGRTPDCKSPVQHAPVPKGSLRIADLGYYQIDAFRAIDAQGAYFLSHYKVNTKLYRSPDGDATLNLQRALPAAGDAGIDRPVWLGQRHRLPVRLLAFPAPPEVEAQRRAQRREQGRKKQKRPSKTQLFLSHWTIYITNAPTTLISLDDAATLARVRWQIELLFKLWKQHGGIDRWRSEQPWRILCEVYAKLVAMLILHWTLLTAVWRYPDRSLVKATGVVRSYVVTLASALAGGLAVTATRVIKKIVSDLNQGCRIQRRSQKPSTWQRLSDRPDAA